MPRYLPAPPAIDPLQPDEALEALSTYVGKLRTGVEHQILGQETFGWSPYGVLRGASDIPQAPTAPSQPTGVQAFGVYRKAIVTWALDLNPAIEGWEVYRGGTTDAHVVGFAENNLFVDDGDLADSTGYTYYVKAVTRDKQRSTISGSAVGTTVTTNAAVATALSQAMAALQNSVIQPEAVTGDQIAGGTIVSGNLAAGSVTSTELATDAVTTAKISAAAVTTAKIGASAVTATELASNAVTTAKINAGAVTTAKVAAAAITATEIATGAVGTTQLAGGAVTAAKIASATITSTELATNAATEVVSDIDSDSQSTTSSTYVDIPNTSISVSAPGGVPILVIGASSNTAAVNTSGIDAMLEVRIRLLRDSIELMEGRLRGWCPYSGSGDSINGSIILPVIDTPSVGTYTYKMQYRCVNASSCGVNGRSIQAMVMKR